MTTPRLNRIVTVSGSTTETARSPVQWGYDKRLLEGFLSEKIGEWYAYSSARPESATLTAQGLLTFGPTGMTLNAVSVGPDGEIQAGVPSLLETLSRDDEDNWVRLTTVAAGDSYLQWTIGDNRLREYSDSVDFPVMDGQLVGSDFDLNEFTYVLVSFARHSAEQPVRTATRKVWAEMLERGSALGVLDITTTEPTTTGSQEEATAVFRYDPDLAVGRSLTDDLDRVWTVDGSRTTEDRRYLEYSLTRTILPAAG